MKGKLRVLFLALCIAISTCACGKADSQNPVDVANLFFSAFEAADYASMKKYCTDSCVEQYFHSDDVNGMVWAKVQEIGEETILENGTAYIFVTVEMETSQNSALYPETETSFYLEFQKAEDGKLLIHSFPTGISHKEGGTQ